MHPTSAPLELGDVLSWVYGKIEVPLGSFQLTSILYVEFLGQKSSEQSDTLLSFAVIFCVLFYLGNTLLFCGLGQAMVITEASGYKTILITSN